ncbi:Homing endonuclease [uncultured bacterium]|nr:Homing endonuclease [uncultured bacterium]
MISIDWIVGFTDSSGCFRISVEKDLNMKYGINILTEFLIIQDIKDIKLLMKVKKFFQCGVVRCIKNDKSNICYYKVRSVKHAHDIILPFFDKHNLLSMKSIEYKRYSYVVRKLYLRENFNKDNLIKILEYLNCKIKIKSES